MTGSLEGHLGRYDDGIGQPAPLARAGDGSRRQGTHRVDLAQPGRGVRLRRTDRGGGDAGEPGRRSPPGPGLTSHVRGAHGGSARLGVGGARSVDRGRRRRRGGARRQRRPVLRPAPRTSPGCSSWSAAATTSHADRLLGDLADSFAGNAYATAVCAAWEAELALWRREWAPCPGRRRSRPDHHRRDRRGDARAPPRRCGRACRGGPLRLDPCRRREGRPWCRRRADRALRCVVPRPCSPASRRPSAARRCRSTGRSPSPVPRGPDCRRRRRRIRGWRWWTIDGGDPYFAAYARWRAAEALLAVDVRSSKNAAAGLLQEAATAASALGAAPLGAEVAGLARRAGIAIGGPEVATEEPSPLDELQRAA